MVRGEVSALWKRRQGGGPFVHRSLDSVSSRVSMCIRAWCSSIYTILRLPARPQFSRLDTFFPSSSPLCFQSSSFLIQRFLDLSPI